MKPMRIFSSAAAALGLGYLFSSAGGCLMSGCETDPAVPTNLAAVAGDGRASLTWEYPELNAHQREAYAEVRYATDGGTGEACAERELQPGCEVACAMDRSRAECTVPGLTNGVSYVFTVVAVTEPTNPSCTSGRTFIRSEPVTPLPTMLP